MIAPVDPFAAADQDNADGAKRAQLAGVERERQARRRADPLPAGGLFDEVRRNTQELI